MYCSKCGTVLPEESVACYKCATPTFLHKPEKKKDSSVNAGRIVATVVAVLLAVVGVGFAVIVLSSNSSITRNIPSSVPVPTRTTVINEIFDIPANSWKHITFQTNRQIFLQGGFKVQSSGQGETVEVLLMTDMEYADWSQSNSFRSFVRTGYVTRDKFSTTLGTYVLVFNNYRALFSSVTVASEVYYD